MQLPPMNIFPGTRFKYNNMLNCVDGASLLGDSPTGWISTELYGWIANHFAKRVSVWPMVLLVDGHSSHIDLQAIHHTLIFIRIPFARKTEYTSVMSPSTFLTFDTTFGCELFLSLWNQFGVEPAVRIVQLIRDFKSLNMNLQTFFVKHGRL